MQLSAEAALGLMAGSTVLGAVVKGFFDWLQSRPKPKTAQERESGAVHLLDEVIERLQQENLRLAGRADELDGELTAVRDRLHVVRKEVHDLNNRLTILLAWIRLTLSPYIDALHKHIRSLGGTPDPMPPLPDLTSGA